MADRRTPRRLLPAALAGAACAVATALGGCGAMAGKPVPAAGAAQQTPAGAHPRWPDDATYALDLAYDARRFELSGAERITFRNSSEAPLQSIWLRAWGNAFGGCREQRAGLQVTAGGALATRQRSCTALQVRLDQPVAPGDRGTVDLRIRVVAPPHPDRFGRFRGAAYFGNALPILAVGDRQGWKLPPYTFAGESFYSLTSAWSVRLRVPRGLRVASTGTESNAPAGGSVVLTAPHARDFMIVVGRFGVRTRTVGGVRLRRFSLAGTPAGSAHRTLEVAAESMRSYIAWYGPYDRPEVDLVDGPREVGHGGLAMEYPELVLTPSDPTSVAHELAHQWFYGIVGDDQWSEPWLDESFAEFSAARLPRSRVPNRLGGCRIPDGRRVPLDASMATLTRGAPDLYVRTVYIGGACLLRAVQRTLGDRRFDALMRGLVADHRDGVVTTPDVVAAMRSAAADRRAAIDRLLRRAGLLG